MNILICGVGGQGTLLASRVLGEYAKNVGLDCKLSEVHGMAQRGGSVVTYVKMDKKVYSPIICEGDADIILSFERLEGMRWSHFAKNGAKILISSQEIMPMPVVIGTEQYPENAKDKLENCIEIDAMKIAEDLGNVKVANVVMLGSLAKNLNLEYSIFLKALLACVPQKTIEVNTKALELGYSL